MTTTTMPTTTIADDRLTTATRRDGATRDANDGARARDRLARRATAVGGGGADARDARGDAAARW